ncbi:MAG: hypothetical protein ACLTBZ_08695 [Faecalispora jeddahensis]|jgi:hypothetical protein|uniref:hypothetical protein n=1 Tax=Eubacteriales TaxID=186802 RepID=UPI00026F3001|nr:MULTISPECIES: hypothetical protein [Eubacteriales]EJF38919.1 hypothetical protein HMPREF1141_2127 [Clostridium sp. MSTE9]MBS5782402.1 hypothetical protein [Clostridium sp.]
MKDRYSGCRSKRYGAQINGYGLSDVIVTQDSVKDNYFIIFNKKSRFFSLIGTSGLAEWAVKLRLKGQRMNARKMILGRKKTPVPQ